MQCIRAAGTYIKADIIDCIVTDDRLIFLVEKGQLGAAIGIKARNLARLRDLFKKTIKFAEFDGDKKRFIFNLCKPYKVNNIVLEESGGTTIAKIEVDQSDKSKLIGKDGRNIEIIRQLARRHSSIKDVQIL